MILAQQLGNVNRQMKKKKYTDYKSILPAFGQRIKELRINKRLTQTEMAAILDIERSTASRLESGHIAPTFQHLILLSETFDTTIDYLLTGKHSMIIPDFGPIQEEIRQLLLYLSKNKIHMHRLMSDFYSARETTNRNKKQNSK
jgi:transcriptional regulator with XRE-family HTH domain